MKNSRISFRRKLGFARWLRCSGNINPILRQDSSRFHLIILVCLLTVSFPAFAQTPTGIDADKPVEINSDTLEIQQEKNIAIFQGNVIAVQGETRLHADKMVVYYRDRNQALPQEEDKKESTDVQKPGGAVHKIEVYDNVVLTTPKETASGDEGVYNVDERKVYLYHNVILSQANNVLKGDSLVHNLKTRESVINGAGGVTNKPVGSARVKALFVPEDQE